MKELIASSTAKRYKIDNTPDKEAEAHLKELIAFLDDIRKAWGSPIKVTSGYRCTQLNTRVGGVATSAHCLGYAADIVPSNSRFSEFVEFLKKYLADRSFDQCIIEKSGFSRWVHIGLYNNKHKQRKMLFSLNK